MLNKMTREEFEKVRLATDDELLKVKFKGVVIIPTRLKHDSDFRIMDFVLCDNHKPICRVGGFADVLWLGEFFNKNHASYRIDCLYKSKLIRVICNKTNKIKYIGSDLTIEEVQDGKSDSY